MPGFETLEPVSVIKKGTAYYEKEKTEIIPEEYFFKIKQDLKGICKGKNRNSCIRGSAKNTAAGNRMFCKCNSHQTIAIV